MIPFQINIGCWRYIESRADSRVTSDFRAVLQQGQSVKTGRVIFFSARQGYGFIKPDDGRSDLFVHFHTLQKAGLTHLKPGQKVTYDTLVARNGKISAIEIGEIEQGL
jgi:CspA family cold shock protein